MEEKEYERTITLENENHIFELTLSDVVLLKNLLDKERYTLIQTYGEEIKKIGEYQRLIKLKKLTRGMINELMDKEWEDLDEESKLSSK